MQAQRFASLPLSAIPSTFNQVFADLRAGRVDGRIVLDISA